MRTFIGSAGMPVTDGFGCLFVFDPGKCSQPGHFGRGSGIKDPRGIRLDPTGKRLFVNNGDRTILALAVATGQLLRANARGEASRPVRSDLQCFSECVQLF
jgi:hypothetical protein